MTGREENQRPPGYLPRPTPTRTKFRNPFTGNNGLKGLLPNLPSGRPGKTRNRPPNSYNSRPSPNAIPTSGREKKPSYQATTKNPFPKLRTQPATPVKKPTYKRPPPTPATRRPTPSYRRPGTPAPSNNKPSYNSPTKQPRPSKPGFRIPFIGGGRPGSKPGGGGLGLGLPFKGRLPGKQNTRKPSYQRPVEPGKPSYQGGMRPKKPKYGRPSGSYQGSSSSLFSTFLSPFSGGHGGQPQQQSSSLSSSSSSSRPLGSRFPFNLMNIFGIKHAGGRPNSVRPMYEMPAMPRPTRRPGTRGPPIRKPQIGGGHGGNHATTTTVTATATARPQTTSPLRLPQTTSSLRLPPSTRPTEQTSSTPVVPAVTRPRPIKLQQTTTAVAVETYDTTISDNAISTEGLPSYARPGYSRPNNAFLTPQALGKCFMVKTIAIFELITK